MHNSSPSEPATGSESPASVDADGTGMWEAATPAHELMDLPLRGLTYRGPVPMLTAAFREIHDDAAPQKS